VTTPATTTDHRRLRTASTNSKETDTILAFCSFVGPFGHGLLHHLWLINFVFVFFLVLLIVINLLTKEGLVTGAAKSLCMVAVDAHPGWNTTTRVYDRRRR
jgi:hypothetical protein